ncbi:MULTISPECIES: hypothetical protein [Streptomyces]|uniref:Uncharacterized protein n=1 Tax=Streptomyces fungicidicus TaxID=68203 RepID=A0ACC7Y6Z8_9ACTN|nr:MULTISPECIES: hypothetical protein [Streptomyces]MBF4134873.1 hypothetical protein [Streptomyces albidoflavus]NUV77661.1 hypothetical protein [Streptomyces fungicidicus]
MPTQRPDDRPAPPETRHAEPQFTPCDPCHHLTLAEAEANAAYDWSKATDCRVLLKRHRATGECSAPEPE